MNRPVVALIAGKTSSGTHGREGEAELRAAIAVLRAALERGGRVILSADSSHVVPLLMGAAEYQEPRMVETSNEVVFPPVILGPFMGPTSMERELLRYTPEGSEESQPATLLEDLISGGLVEQGWGQAGQGKSHRQAFSTLLFQHQALGIVAIGSNRYADPFLRAAEDYAKVVALPRVRLFTVAIEKDSVARGLWKPIDSQWQDERLPPPMMDGEIVGKSSERRSWDEWMVVLARRAAEEASLTLAIDRAVGTMIEEPSESDRFSR